ncbi:MAG: hypothetical protein ACK4ZG_03695 [Bacteroidota bacterium]|jgi:hypothetical protein
MTPSHLLLYRISELMIANGEHVLPVDELFDDTQIGDFVKSIQIDSPYQQLLQEGVLTESVRNEKLHVSFTVEGYFHYILGEVISDLSESKDASFLIDLLKNNSLNGIREGIEQCLIRDVNFQRIDRLICLIDVGGDAEKIVRYPLAHAFLKMSIQSIFERLMDSPSINDWNVIKQVRSILLGNQKNHIVEQIDAIIKESEQLRNTINSLLNENNELVFRDALTLITFYSELNALDQAANFYTQFIEKAELNNFNNSLAEGLEHLGNNEYKRSGRSGYKAAMDAFTRSLFIREQEHIPQKQKLKYTYRSLGLAYLSLGLQVIEANEYFEMSKAIMLEESDESAELAGINLYIGLANFWRGLRGTGRWGHPDVKLMDGLDFDLFDYADSQFQLAYHYYCRNMGKSHPQTLEAVHYLQENRYALGNYEKAIPWLKKYVEVLPFKSKKHTDNFYFYCLIVSLEELAKSISATNAQRARLLLQEALSYAKTYDKTNLIADRLITIQVKIDNDILLHEEIPAIDALSPIQTDCSLKAKWYKWSHSDELKNFITNPWLVAESGIWFYNVESKEILQWHFSSDNLFKISPLGWPDAVNRLVYDSMNKVFYAWSSIRSAVFQLSTPYVKWQRLSYGANDAHACGATFGYDSLNNRLFEFGGYGYFTYKNWFWVYDLLEKKWIQLKENKPGVPPYPRNGQLMPYANGEKLILVSGIGSDTGIQREHKPRRGLGSATDVGYFTWLRDAYVMDLRTMEWREQLPSNHGSIRHEGAMGYIEPINCIVNWSGTIPSPIFGQEATTVQLLTCWRTENSDGFNLLEYSGDIPPYTGGYFQSIPRTSELLYIHAAGIWKLIINDQ